MIPGRSPDRQLNHKAGQTSPKVLDVLALRPVVLGRPLFAADFRVHL
jgi:hypothetical protein